MQLAVVIVRGPNGADLRWSPSEARWHLRTANSDRFEPAAESLAIAGWTYRTPHITPSPQVLREAVELLLFDEERPCQDCGSSALADHVIFPDLWRGPRLQCTHQPSPACVAVTTDAYKHWGHPSACSRVNAARITEQHRGGDYGYYRFGRPLTSIEAARRRWCPDCATAAAQARREAAENLAFELDTTDPLLVAQALVNLTEPGNWLSGSPSAIETDSERSGGPFCVAFPA